MSFSGSPVIIGGQRVRNASVSFEEIRKIFCAITDVHPWVVQGLWCSPEPQPACRSERDLHQPPGNVVNSSFSSELVGVEAGFTFDDCSDKNRIDMVLTRYPRDRRMIGNGTAQKMGSKAPRYRLMNQPIHSYLANGSFSGLLAPNVFPACSSMITFYYQEAGLVKKK